MNIEDIKKIVLDTGCSETVAEWMLDFTNGDIEKAKKIIFSLPKDILVVVIKISFNEKREFGVILYAYNLTLNKIEKLDVVFTDDEKIINISDNVDIKKLEKEIQSYVSSDKKFLDDADALKEYLLTDSSKEHFVSLIKDDFLDKEGIKRFFSDVIFKVFADDNFLIKDSYFKIDSFQFNAAERVKKTEDDSSKKEAETKVETRIDYKSESVVILKSQPIISPVSGKPIPKLKRGDMIFAEIVDNREIGTYLKKLLKTELEKEGKYDNIVATVEDLEYSTTTDSVTLMIKYGPGIYGRMIVSRDLKIECPIEDNKEESENTDKNNILSWLIIIAAIIFILLLILKK